MNQDAPDQMFSEQLVYKIFNSLSAHIAIIDQHGQILKTNQAWKDFSIANGLSEQADFSQMNYLNICQATTGEGMEDAKAVASGLRRLIGGKVSQFLYDYPCHSPEGQRWFYMRAVLMDDTESVKVIICHEDITQLKLAQKSLTEHQELLEDKNQSLEEANIALKVLLKQREDDKTQLERKFLGNVKTLILPYINKLKKSQLNEKDQTLVQIVDDHLNDILSSMIQKLSHANILLTPQEMQVAALVKDGKTTSQIAEILFVSDATISFHRKNLRDKLGLKNKQANLRSYLLSIS